MKQIMESWRLYLGEGLKLNPPKKEIDRSRCVELKANPKAGYRSEIKCIPKDGVVDMRYFDTSSIDPNDPQYSGYTGAAEDQLEISRLQNMFHSAVYRGAIIQCSGSLDCVEKNDRLRLKRKGLDYE